MRYLLLIYTAEVAAATEGPLPGEAMDDELGPTTRSASGSRERDMFRAGEALHPTSAATTVRVRDGKTMATDGPYAETKEALGGFYLIEAANLDDAIEAASRIPGATAGAVEVRPIWEFAAEPTAEAVASATLTPRAVVDRLFREESGRAVATLIRLTGDFDLAEEAVQEAFVVALERWPRDGLPANPGAWITTTAKNRAIDRLRRAKVLAEKEATIRRQAEIEAELAAVEPHPEDEMSPIADDRLRLIFTCCHPALPLEAQVALTLRTLGGLTTPEIAHAFLVPEPTLAQRLVRAKKKIRDAGIPYRVPPDHLLPERLDAVLRVLYLDLQRGLLGVVRRRARPARAVRRGDPARAGPRRAHARRAGGDRPARADAPPRRPPRGPGGSGRASSSCSRTRIARSGTGAGSRRGRSWSSEPCGCAGRGRTRSRPRSRPSTTRPRPRRTRTGPRSRCSTTGSRRSTRRRSSSSTGRSPWRWSTVRPAGWSCSTGSSAGGTLDDYHLLHAARADLLRRLDRRSEASLAYRRAYELAGNEAERGLPGPPPGRGRRLVTVGQRLLRARRGLPVTAGTDTRDATVPSRGRQAGDGRPWRSGGRIPGEGPDLTRHDRSPIGACRTAGRRRRSRACRSAASAPTSHGPTSPTSRSRRRRPPSAALAGRVPTVGQPTPVVRPPATRPPSCPARSTRRAWTSARRTTSSSS